jgi:hypothetical protein
MGAAMQEADAATAYGQCVSAGARAIMHQKKLPKAEVARAQMEAAKTYCKTTFGQ